MTDSEREKPYRTIPDTGLKKFDDQAEGTDKSLEPALMETGQGIPYDVSELHVAVSRLVDDKKTK